MEQNGFFDQVFGKVIDQVYGDSAKKGKKDKGKKWKRLSTVDGQQVVKNNEEILKLARKHGLANMVRTYE